MKTNFEIQYDTSACGVDDIILACRRRDHKAQLQIYKLYYKAVYNICFLSEHDPGKAERTMFEAFLNAFENIDLYKNGTCFSSWLFSYINRVS